MRYAELNFFFARGMPGKLRAEMFEFERKVMLEALDEAHGSHKWAAYLVGMKRTAFVMRMKRHGMILNKPTQERKHYE